MNFIFKLQILIFCANYSFSQNLTLENGIFIETPKFKDTTPHKYSIDNISYVIGNEFVYDYIYLDSNNRKFKFIKDDNYTSKNPLNLIKVDSLQGNIIQKIKLIVSDPLRMYSSFDSSYNQTVFSYNYFNDNFFTKDTLCLFFKKNKCYYNLPCGDEYTGLIDNRMNLWIHPPRQYTFRILQLCPYPFYYLDESITQWEWTLKTGGFYLDTRWIESKESININFVYKRMPDKKLKTNFGVLDCKVIFATGTINNESITSHTYLKSYYHPDYGFVKLEYDLINNSKIIINLMEMNKLNCE